MTTLQDFRDPTEQLHGATHALEDAIHRLIGPRRGVVANAVHIGPSLYANMRSDIAGQQGTGLGNAARSLPPAWLAAIDWLHDVERTVHGWWIDTDASTESRLDSLSRWQWQKADLVQVEDMTARVAEWVRRAERLLDARASFPVTGNCPECHVAVTKSIDACGETVRSPVLRASVSGAHCQACDASWPADQLWALADLVRKQ
ncbi:hypothetical protein [Rhodococcus sp. IEGM 1330]|uniref:DUF7341 domain-containing protein n=1 Tax=Rhodococcus sp. IEGM 1330 TaxID=3082225 RepID=UPI0029556C6E|nr:hypothetical protein [Rhodococcus sp. IEGM 1330]MDV8024961.1 hypothetical protein [Rhodococcus sp. IEGM 1330]